ncbi:MAG: hypothetical protein AAGC55_16530, partial [Myxococcota bacterium]
MPIRQHTCDCVPPSIPYAAPSLLGAALLSITLFAAGCGDPIDNPGVLIDAAAPEDTGFTPVACDPAGDNDNDCISNQLEGCGEDGDQDSDSDGAANYDDLDADGDGIFDAIEVGPDCAAPADTDDDGIPDFLDTDSDDDGQPDENEDRDGDGVIGTCTTACADDSGCDAKAGEYCSKPMTADMGVCVSIDCQDGETDPYNPDTDGDGLPDDLEGTYICDEPSDGGSVGIRPIVVVDSGDTPYVNGDWRIALE